MAKGWTVVGRSFLAGDKEDPAKRAKRMKKFENTLRVMRSPTYNELRVEGLNEYTRRAEAVAKTAQS